MSVEGNVYAAGQTDRRTDGQPLPAIALERELWRIPGHFISEGSPEVCQQEGPLETPKCSGGDSRAIPFTFRDASSHLLRGRAGEDAALASGRKVTVHHESVSGAALVRVDPVFAWKEEGSNHTLTAGAVWGLGPSHGGLPTASQDKVSPKLVCL